MVISCVAIGFSLIVAVAALVPNEEIEIPLTVVPASAPLLPWITRLPVTA